MGGFIERLEPAEETKAVGQGGSTNHAAPVLLNHPFRRFTSTSTQTRLTGMPLLFVLTLAVQIGLVIHVMKTGRNTYWIWLLLFAPGVGAAAYFFVELFPEIRASRAARRMSRSIANKLNPEGELRAAEDRLDIADTVENVIGLADEYMAKERFTEAKVLFEKARTGIHSDDPKLFMGIAGAQFGMQDYQGTMNTLNELKRVRPDAANADHHLLFARCLEGLGSTQEAVQEYEELVTYYPGAEATCRFAELLGRLGQHERARTLYEQVLRQARIGGKHYRTMHAQWIRIAERELGG